MPLDSLVPRECEHDRRDDERMRDAVLFDRAEHDLEVEAWDRHDRRALTQGVVEHDHESVDVEERKDTKRNFVLAGQEVRLDLAQVRNEIAMREQHALREAGRAARIGKRDDVVRVHGNLRSLVVRLEQLRERPLADHEHVLDL